MPAVEQSERDRLEDSSQPIKNVGNLTFLLVRTIKNYWASSSRRYINIAEILGALLCSILYFWDKVGRNYEKRKESENGEVWKEENGDI